MTHRSEKRRGIRRVNVSPDAEQDQVRAALVDCFRDAPAMQLHLQRGAKKATTLQTEEVEQDQASAGRVDRFWLLLKRASRAAAPSSRSTPHALAWLLEPELLRQPLALLHAAKSL